MKQYKFSKKIFLLTSIALTGLLASNCSQIGNPVSVDTFSESYIESAKFSTCIKNTIVLQGKEKSQDGHVWSLRPDEVRGSYYFFDARCWTWGGEMGITRSLINFDLSGIPAGSTIESATLSLSQNTSVVTNNESMRHSTLSGSNECLLQRITSPWSVSTISWNTQPTTSTRNQVIIPASTNEIQDYSLNVTQLVKDMVANRSRSHGFMMKLADENYYRAMAFAATDSVAGYPDDPTKYPKLEITYSTKAKAVKQLTKWVRGHSNPKVAGKNRCMVVMIMGEHHNENMVQEVTYGGQPMRISIDHMVGVGPYSYASIFFLPEAGVRAATSGDIKVLWQEKPSAGQCVVSVMLGNVDPENPTGEAGSTLEVGTSISLPLSETVSGDMIIMSGVTQDNNTQTFNNGFSKMFESNSCWGDGVGGYKMCTGSDEMAGYTQSAVGGMILNAAIFKKAQ